MTREQAVLSLVLGPVPRELSHEPTLDEIKALLCRGRLSINEVRTFYGLRDLPDQAAAIPMQRAQGRSL